MNFAEELIPGKKYRLRICNSLFPGNLKFWVSSGKKFRHLIDGYFFP
jgi:hypothetical protein